ncbi:MAG: hybrid sensor histidine kinase/response regulator [Nitrospirota bacterium]|nr:hybrid sensor histidine kinase/response regulator [Nitrospirota bacterium]
MNPTPPIVLLSKDHTILERPRMEFRPFGIEKGRKIRDVTGVKVNAYITYLEESIARKQGAQAGTEAVQTLCTLLNARISDPTYHVTPSFLGNVWNSYSYEFVCFLSEFCILLSEDPTFQFHAGKAKFISPVIQTLGRPFSLPQIFKMFPHFGQKFAKDSIEFGVGKVTDRSAILRMKFTDHIYEQFGPYRRRCAEQICQASQAALSAVPQDIHHQGYAAITERQCIAKDDEWCEWEFTWTQRKTFPVIWSMGGLVAGLLAFLYLQVWHPSLTILECALLTLAPTGLGWLAMVYRLKKHRIQWDQLIQEQLETVERQHEELRESYLDLEQTSVELRRTVTQLTVLHEAGLLFSSSLDRETVIHHILAVLTKKFNYERAMLSFYDSARKVAYDARLAGVSDEVASEIRSMEIPITTRTSLEGKLLLQGQPILIEDIHAPQIWSELHPLNQNAANMLQVKSLVGVPIIVKEQIIGCLVIDRNVAPPLNHHDVEIMLTFAAQAGLALDNTNAYQQIAELNANLEERVQVRTKELEVANTQLQEHDRYRSQFVAHVSHELRSPLTSMKGFVENMVDGLTGPISQKQEQYLTRIQTNIGRLTHMIVDLLDRAKLEAGKMEVSINTVLIVPLVKDIVEQFQPLAYAKGQQLTLWEPPSPLTVLADGDKVNQIVNNLIENAIKYTPHGGAISVKIRPDHNQRVEISVTDTGEGIPPLALPHIFTPFFRIKRNRPLSIQGLGLGLSITKQLLELQHGTIEVSSQEDQGTTFTITLPHHAPPTTTPTRPLDNNRILVVDDDPDICEFLVDRLKGEGFQVDSASNGQEALLATATTAFAGIFLDIGLPDISGLVVLEQIRVNHPRLPVIMVTATKAEDRAKSAMEKGANAYLLKPLDPTQFSYVLREWFQADKQPTP